MNCWYCHNRHFLNTEGDMSEEEILSEISRNSNFLDAVVISGGEPALAPDIKQFILKLKDMGLKIKLDTNGTKPEVIKELLSDIDFIAMDIKAPFDRYKMSTCTDDDIGAIKESIELIRTSDKPYEFRTTMTPQMNTNDIVSIAEYIKGAVQYAIQQYIPRDGGKVSAIKLKPHSDQYIFDTAEKVRPLVKRLIVRGTKSELKYQPPTTDHQPSKKDD